jgi:hypothetical protein
MPLSLQPNPDSPDEYFVKHAAFEVGRVSKRKTAMRPETQWLWSMNSLLRGPEGMRLSGTAGSPDDAKSALDTNWRQWLAWANLSEDEKDTATNRDLRIVSVVISKSEPNEQP